MEPELYKRLAVHLDNLPGGYPATEDGLELRILQRLFTPEDAELALHLTVLPEPARVIAYRAGLSLAEAEERLESMAQRGLIYRVAHHDQPAEYQAMQFVIGIWEAQLNRLDEGLIQDVDEYFRQGLFMETWAKVPQLRTIPVGESIPVHNDILAYNQAEQIVRKQWKLVVAECICRKERHMVGEGCDKPMETCLVFGKAAEYYQRNGLGREIGQAEALRILALANEAGLVLQPGNSQEPGNICCCCGDCCGVLRNAKRHPVPSSIITSAYLAFSDADICSGCGTCLDRCQMEAIDLDAGYAVISAARCIGCGLCVTTCETGALSLQLKPQEQQPSVPGNGMETGLRLWRSRGKVSNRELAMMVARSKADRLLTLNRKTH